MNEVLATVIETIVTIIVTSATTGAIVYAKAIKQKDALMKEGLLSLLRAEIIRCHEKYTDKQYCPIYAKDAIEKEYDVYHRLGGNGTVAVLYQEILALPEKQVSRSQD